MVEYSDRKVICSASTLNVRLVEIECSVMGQKPISEPKGHQTTLLKQALRS
jgi:hypothetical protein